MDKLSFPHKDVAVLVAVLSEVGEGFVNGRSAMHIACSETQYSAFNIALQQLCLIVIADTV